MTVPDRFGGNPHEKIFLVAPEHEHELRGYTQRLTRYSRLFIVLMAAALIASIIFSLLDIVAGVALSLIGLSVVMLVFPFSTPETVEAVGVRRSVQLARSGGFVLLVVAVGLGALG